MGLIVRVPFYDIWCHRYFTKAKTLRSKLSKAIS